MGKQYKTSFSVIGYGSRGVGGFRMDWVSGTPAGLWVRFAAPTISSEFVTRHVGFCCSFYTTCVPCCHSLSLSAITLAGTEGPTV